ncbi:MAG: hypothetical protein ACTSPB_00360 [Candidatus Thorarchaeota archaeon]
MSRCKFLSKRGMRCIKPHHHNGNDHRDRQNNHWYDDGVVLDEVVEQPKKKRLDMGSIKSLVNPSSVR